MSGYLTACIAIGTSRYPEEWGPKPEGPGQACPALDGTYANAGEFSPRREWLVLPLPIPLPDAASSKFLHDGRFYAGPCEDCAEPYKVAATGEDVDSFRIEIDDSQTARITLVADEQAIAEWTLSRENEDFRCGGGRLIYHPVGSYPHAFGTFFGVTRNLARASDGSLLMLDSIFWSPASFEYHDARYWSRHPLIGGEQLPDVQAVILGELLPDDAQAVLIEILKDSFEPDAEVSKVNCDELSCGFQVDRRSISNVRRFEEKLTANPRVTSWSGPPESVGYEIVVERQPSKSQPAQ